MTYQDFINTFVKTDKTCMTYQQGDESVYVVKTQITDTAQALYANFQRGGEMEIVGYIDYLGRLRFPTYTFEKR